MLQIVICDDQPRQIATIRAMTQTFFSAFPDCDYKIESFDNPLLFLAHIEKTGGCDIALLDICMPGLIGTEVAREIRRRRDQTEIIFLTTSDEFAVDAFALKAAHYLIKPFTQAEFNEALKRALQRFTRSAPQRLMIKTEGGDLRSLELNEIQYIESANHVQNIHLEAEVCTEMRRSLARLLEEIEKMAPGQFITPYKGYLVNQRAIVTIEAKYILLRSGAKIPIPRSSFREIQARYVTYRFETCPTQKENLP